MKEKKRFQSSLRAKRWLMGDSCRYYPVQHYFKLIEQSIQRLELDEVTSFAQQDIQCLYIFTCWFLYTLNTVGQLAKLDIDPDGLQELPRKLREFVADLDVSERLWCGIIMLITACYDCDICL